MLKIIQARQYQYLNQEFLGIQTVFSKSRATRNQIANIYCIIEKENFRKKDIYFCIIDYTKSFDCVDHYKLWKILKDIRTQVHFTCLLINLYAYQGATAPDMEKQTGSKLRKEFIKAVYCHLAYLTYMHKIVCEILGWMNHKLKLRFLREMLKNLRYADDITLVA